MAGAARRANSLYAVKASRFLTHMKKLKDPQDPVQLFFSRADRLGRTLGPVLYQLPSRWPVNLERLRGFLRTLPRRRRHAIEFREPSWYTPRCLLNSSATASRCVCTTCLARRRADSPSARSCTSDFTARGVRGRYSDTS